MNEVRPTPSLDEFLPQKPPMRFIDRVLEWDDKTVCAEGTVAETWAVVEHGKARAVCLFELMTQAVAAHQALVEMRDGRTGEGMGVVIGCRKLSLERSHVHVGETIVVHAELQFGDGAAGVFNASASLEDGTPLATSRFSVRKLDELP